MPNIADEPTYCCDVCGVPVVLRDLVPIGREHWCRFCVARPANAGRSTNRADGNKLARGTTVFEDWPGSGE